MLVSLVLMKIAEGADVATDSKVLSSGETTADADYNWKRRKSLDKDELEKLIKSEARESKGKGKRKYFRGKRRRGRAGSRSGGGGSRTSKSPRKAEKRIFGKKNNADAELKKSHSKPLEKKPIKQEKNSIEEILRDKHIIKGGNTERNPEKSGKKEHREHRKKWNGKKSKRNGKRSKGNGKVNRNYVSMDMTRGSTQTRRKKNPKDTRKYETMNPVEGKIRIIKKTVNGKKSVSNKHNHNHSHSHSHGHRGTKQPLKNVKYNLKTTENSVKSKEDVNPNEKVKQRTFKKRIVYSKKQINKSGKTIRYKRAIKTHKASHPHKHSQRVITQTKTTRQRVGGGQSKLDEQPEKTVRIKKKTFIKKKVFRKKEMRRQGTKNSKKEHHKHTHDSTQRIFQTTNAPIDTQTDQEPIAKDRLIRTQNSTTVPTNKPKKSETRNPATIETPIDKKNQVENTQEDNDQIDEATGENEDTEPKDEPVSADQLWQIKANELFDNPLFVSRNIVESRQQTVLDSKATFKKVITRDIEVKLERENESPSHQWFKLIEFYKYKESVYPRKTLVYKKDSESAEWVNTEKSCSLPLFLETPKSTSSVAPGNCRFASEGDGLAGERGGQNADAPVVPPADHQRPVGGVSVPEAAVPQNARFPGFLALGNRQASGVSGRGNRLPRKRRHHSGRDPVPAVEGAAPAQRSERNQGPETDESPAARGGHCGHPDGVVFAESGGGLRGHVARGQGGFFAQFDVVRGADRAGEDAVRVPFVRAQLE